MAPLLFLPIRDSLTHLTDLNGSLLKRATYSSSCQRLTTGAIVAIAIAVVFFLLFVIVVSEAYNRRKRARRLAAAPAPYNAGTTAYTAPAPDMSSNNYSKNLSAGFYAPAPPRAVYENGSHGHHGGGWSGGGDGGGHSSGGDGGGGGGGGGDGGGC